MTPSKLHKTAKCKHNIGQTLQHLESALHLEVKDNKGCRRECKVVKKLKKYDLTMLEKFSLFFS